MARHATESGDARLASEWWRRAAERALAQLSLHEVAAHLQAGLSVVRQAPAQPWRERADMALHAMLGTLHMLEKGWAAPDVQQAYERANELARVSDDVEEAMWPLWGLCVYHMVQGDIHRAVTIGQRMETVGRQAQSRQGWLVHDMMQVQLGYYSGRWDVALRHAQQVSHRYADPQDRSLISLYSTDLLLVAKVHAMHAAWITREQMDIDQAYEDVRARAMTLQHPYSLAWTLTWGAMIHLHRRDTEALRRCAEQGAEMAETHGYAYVRSMAAFVLGWCDSQHEASRDAGLLAMREGLQAFRATGAGIAVPFFLTLLAEAMGEAGHLEEALDCANEAQSLTDQGGEAWYEPETLRVRAVLLARRPAAESGMVYELLQRGRQRALSQGAKRWAERCMHSWQEIDASWPGWLPSLVPAR